MISVTLSHCTKKINNVHEHPRPELIMMKIDTRYEILGKHITKFFSS